MKLGERSMVVVADSIVRGTSSKTVLIVREVGGQRGPQEDSNLANRCLGVYYGVRVH